MRICIVSILVDDQDKALAFYTQKLGFEVSKDVGEGDSRWLTVVAPDDAGGTELLLEPIGLPEAAAYQKTLHAQGIPATSFESADIQADYARLSDGCRRILTENTGRTAAR